MFVEVVNSQGKVIVGSRAVAASPQSSFGALLGAAMSEAREGGGGENLSRPLVRVSKGGKGNGHSVDLDTPVGAASDASMSFVRVLLTPEKAREATAAKKAAPAGAFAEIMGAAGHCS